MSSNGNPGKDKLTEKPETNKFQPVNNSININENSINTVTKEEVKIILEEIQISVIQKI